MNTQQRLEGIAAFVIREAKRLGATDADVTIGVYDSVDTSVRLGQVEEMQGAQGRGLEFRAFVGKNSAKTSTSDFRRKSLTKLVRNTIAMARALEPDQFAGLPDAAHLAKTIADLQLADAQLASLSVDRKIQLATQAEAAAMAADKRITNSEGGGFSDVRSITVYANSLGFLGSYSGTRCTLQCSVVASDEGGQKVGSWWTQSRRLSGLEDPDWVGKTAAHHALRMLGARKVKSQEVAVVYSPEMASRLLGQFAGAAMGTSIYRKASFLVGKLDQMVASPEVNIVDNGLLPGELGSRPFSSEGLPTGVREIIKDGKLTSYFIDTYAARKLGTTPNGGTVTNLCIMPGKASHEEIIGSVKNGLYLTNVSGPGFNAVTGDYSLGASGIWIEDGKLAFPVEEITVASNVLEMFSSIEAIGNDLQRRSAVCSPTLKFARMMVAGE